MRSPRKLIRSGPVETSVGILPGNSVPIGCTYLHVPFTWAGKDVVAKLPLGCHTYPETWCRAFKIALAEIGHYPITGIDDWRDATVEVYSLADSIEVNPRSYWKGTLYE